MGKISNSISRVHYEFAKAIFPPRPRNPIEEADVWGRFEIISTECAYCGKPASGIDHVNPLTFEKRSSGYFDEINNIVPCCGPCNSSKGNKNWRDWIDEKINKMSSSYSEEDQKIVIDMRLRRERLEKFQSSFGAIKINIDEIIGKERYSEYLSRIIEIKELLSEADTHANEIRLDIEKYLQITRS